MASLDRKQQVIPILWGACIAEALIAVIYLLLLPVDPKNVVFAGYSMARLLIIACMFVISIFLAWLLYSNIRRKGPGNLLTLFYRLEFAEGWTFLVSQLVILVCLVLLIATPPFLGGARIERLAPILIWLCLCGFQISIALFVYRREKISLSVSILHDFIKRLNSDQRIGYLLIFLSLLIGFITIFYTYYNSGDEGDTYAVGWLISKGYILYKDVFSHHFPFSYMWIGLIGKIFGPSILMFRLSLLLLRVGLFIVTMRLAGNTFVIGLTSVAWSLVGPLFLGNLMLYYSFDCIFIFCGVFLVLSILNKDVEYSIKHSMFAGVLIGLASLTDPFMLLPGAFIAIFLAITGIQKGAGLKQKIINALSPFFFACLIFVLYTAYLFATSSLSDFLQNAILFNTQIYSRYTGQTFSISRITQIIRSGLNLFNPSIRTITSPYFYWEDYNGLNNWAFTALFFRLSIIFTSVTIILRKKYMTGIFIYLIGAALYYRGEAFFQGMVFNIFAIATACISAIEFLSTITIFFRNTGYKLIGRKLINLTIICTTGIISVMLVVLNLRMAEFWVRNRSHLSYNSQFGHIINDSGYLRQFACGYEDASLLVYPGNSGMYFFSNLPPSSPYIFMTPWVAEIGEQKVITELKEKAAIIYIDKEGSVWDFPVRKYLSDLISFLDREYIEVDKNVYISPIIEQYCQSQP